MPLLVLFFGLPILEIWLLLSVSDQIGGWPTIALVLLTGFVGMALLRVQGPATLLRAQQKMAKGEMPATEMIEGLCLAVGGALLLTPGFVTDVIGLSCLIPGLRRLLLSGLMKAGMRRMSSAQFGSGGFQGGQFHSTHFSSEAQFHSRGEGSPKQDSNPPSGNTLEGEYERRD